MRGPWGIPVLRFQFPYLAMTVRSRPVADSLRQHITVDVGVVLVERFVECASDRIFRRGGIQ